MRRTLILGLAVAALAGTASAQSYQSWGDAREGGYRIVHGDPNGPGEYYEEEVYRRALPQPPPPPPAYYAYDDGYREGGQRPCGCGGEGGYEVPTYGYASQNYGWPGQGCCIAGGELRFGYLGSGHHAGGVGYGDGRDYHGGGGGYYYGGGYAHSGAWASSSARAYSSSSSSTRVQVR
jgi:hypothetical protein